VGAAFFAESCALVEKTGESQHSDCPPTCVTCGCCVQAVEPTDIVVYTSFAAPVSGPAVPEYRLIQSEPRDVLHVPKR
jgi:hypothetical protein